MSILFRLLDEPFHPFHRRQRFRCLHRLHHHLRHHLHRRRHRRRQRRRRRHRRTKNKSRRHQHITPCKLALCSFFVRPFSTNSCLQQRSQWIASDSQTFTASVLQIF